MSELGRMGMLLVALAIVFGIGAAVAIWCCVRVGGGADRRLERMEDAEQ